MIALLRELRPQVSNDRQIRIDDLLASVGRTPVASRTLLTQHPGGGRRC